MCDCILAANLNARFNSHHRSSSSADANHDASADESDTGADRYDDINADVDTVADEFDQRNAYAALAVDDYGDLMQPRYFQSSVHAMCVLGQNCSTKKFAIRQLAKFFLLKGRFSKEKTRSSVQEYKESVQS